MGSLKYVQDFFLRTKDQLQENSFDSILWIVNVIPNFAGFGVQKDEISCLAPFWMIHLTLLFYVYGVGNFVFQFKYAQGASDLVKSYVNVSLLILTFTNSYWWLTKRSLLKAILKEMKINDELAKRFIEFRKKHERQLKIVKIIVFIFYGSNYLDALLIYLPYRVDVTNNYCMTPCVGLEPLTASPNREICLFLLCLQEFTIMAVVLNYQAMTLFLIAHTAVMYNILSEEIMSLNYYGQNELNVLSDNVSVKSKLSSITARHASILNVNNTLKSLYTMPIGVNYGSNAVCMCLFFFLPLQEYVKFMPILIYCFLVFFLNSLLGQQLINASEKFERAVYSCGWENFDLKDKKTVYIILLQAQKPVEILAADIIPVNIYTFARTIQGIYKFVTVVKL